MPVYALFVGDSDVPSPFLALPQLFPHYADLLINKDVAIEAYLRIDPSKPKSS